MRRFVESNGMEVALSSPDELARFQLAELERWGRIIRTANILPE